MITSIYNDESKLVATSISGGRPHFTYRQPARAVSTYNYELTYAENFHTLSAIIFGTDEYWWVLSDLNKPMDSFEMEVSDMVKLPNNLVKDKAGLTKFW